MDTWWSYSNCTYERFLRNKKTQKTKETQYVDADDHPFHTNEISYSGVVLVELGDRLTIGL